MKPTLENLDQWLFDSVEGNLSAEQQQLLDNFLASQPELLLEQEMWKEANFSSGPITFEPKTALYRKKQFAFKYYHAAALLLLLLGIVNFMTYSEQSQNKSNSSNDKASTLKINKPLPKQFKQFKQFNLFKNPNKRLSNHIIIASIEKGLAPNLNVASNPQTMSSAGLYPTQLSLEEDKWVTKINYRFPELIGGYRTNHHMESLAGIDVDFKSNSSRHFSKLQRINQFAQKELGLSNNQSYDLLLPGQNNIDANISSVGSQSQTRFQSMSLGRSHISDEQALVGQQVSLDGYARNLRSGLGMQANYMQYANGAITDYEIGMIASPKVMLNRYLVIEPAVRLRMGARSVDAQKLSTIDFIEFQNADMRTVDIDSTQGIGRRLLYRDLDIGLAIQTPILFFSAQLENVFEHFDYAMGNQIEYTKSRAPQQLTLALGTQYASRNNKFRFSPYLLYTNNRLENQLNAGMQFNTQHWQFGLSMSQNQQYQLSAGFFGRHAAILVQSCQQQLLTLNTPSYLHQLILRFYSQQSRQARRYINL